MKILKNLNQKGIVAEGVILVNLLSFLVLGVVVGSIQHFRASNIPTPETEASIKNASVVDGEPSYSINPSPSIYKQAVAQASPAEQVAITHDGSRTGPLVKYHTLCDNKDVTIYENELVPFRRITGDLAYSTKTDIQCYQDQMNQVGQQGYINSSYPQYANGGYTPPAYNPPAYNPPMSLQQYQNSHYIASPPPLVLPTFTQNPLPQIIDNSPQTPCVPVPPGFGGSVSRYDSNGYPCAN